MTDPTPATPTAPRRPPPRRSRRNRMIAGVCGGMAERRGWNVTLVRAAFVVLTILPILPGIPIYLFLWLFIRLEDEPAKPAMGFDEL